MKTPLYGLTVFLGIVLAVHMGMNGKVMSSMGNARVGNALFWCIGALGAVLITEQPDGRLVRSAD